MTIRCPVVAGLTPAAGASTLAAALHARETMRADGDRPCWLDVLVCRADERSLVRARAMSTRPPGPVLVVTGGSAAARARGPGRPRPLPDGWGSRFSAVVVLPEVARWRGRVVFDEAAGVLGEPVALLGPLTGYAAALRLVVAALLATGGLSRAEPPLVVPVHSTVDRTRVLPALTDVTSIPRARPSTAAADRTATVRELDDHMIERELLAAELRARVTLGRAG